MEFKQIENYFFNNEWHSYDGIYHNYGIGEPARTLGLPNGDKVDANIKYNFPQFNSLEVAFGASHKGDFVHISSSDEKAYDGWKNWKKYTLEFGPGIFNSDNINVQFTDNIVEGYTYQYDDEELDFVCDDSYSTSGQRFNCSLYFNNGKELILINLEEFVSELEDNSVSTNDIKSIKKYLLRK